MRKLIFITVIGLSLTSCQPDTLSKSVVVPATLENIKMPEEGFTVVTTLTLLADSVRVYSSCDLDKVPKVSPKTDYVYEVDQMVCSNFVGYFKAYKGIIISENGGNQQVTEIAFLSQKTLTQEDLISTELGTFVKVKCAEDFKIGYYPDYPYSKIFIKQ